MPSVKPSTIQHNLPKNIGIVLAGSSNLQHWPRSRTHYPIQFQRETREFSPFQNSLRALYEWQPQTAHTVMLPSASLKTARAQIDELNLAVPPVIIVEPVECGTLNGFFLALENVCKINMDASLIIMDANNPPDDLANFLRTANQLCNSSYIKEKIICCTFETARWTFDSSTDCVIPLGEHHLFKPMPETNTRNWSWKPVGTYFTTPRFAHRLFKSNNQNQLKTCANALNNSKPFTGAIWPNINIWSSLIPGELTQTLKASPDKILLRPVDWIKPSVLNIDDQQITSSILIDTQNTKVTGRGHLIAVAGCDGLHITTSPDATLITRADSKIIPDQLFQELKNTQRVELFDHATHKTVWGHETQIDRRRSCIVNKIGVFPGTSIPPHFHNHRSESWYVLSGTGIGKVANKEINMQPGAMIDIPCNAIHSLINTGTQELTLLEIQRGKYLNDSDSIKTKFNPIPQIMIGV